MLLCGTVFKILEKYCHLVITRWHSLQGNYERCNVCSGKSGTSHMSTSQNDSASDKGKLLTFNPTRLLTFLFTKALSIYANTLYSSLAFKSELLVINAKIISCLLNKVLRISPHSWAHRQPNIIKVKGSIQPESTLTPRSRVAFLLLKIHQCKGSLRSQCLNHRNHQGIGQLYFHTLAKSSLVIRHMLWGVSCQYTDSLAGDRTCGKECKEIGNTAHITYKLSNMHGTHNMCT